MTSFTPSGAGRVLPTALRSRILRAGDDAGRALALADDVRRAVGLQSPGNTRRMWRGLAELGALNLTAARCLGPHLEALAILQQAREFDLVVFAPAGSTWGVFTDDSAARVHAERTPTGGWLLTGEVSGSAAVGSLSHALVSARTDRAAHSLFSVRLHDDGVTVDARDGGSVRFLRAHAHVVGAQDWYTSRPGHALAAAGEAAMWWGAACGLAQKLHLRLARPTPDAMNAVNRTDLWDLGRCDTALFAGGAVLERLAGVVDREGATRAPEWAEALRVRGIVHDACETTLSCVLRSLDAAPESGPDGDDDARTRQVRNLREALRTHRPREDLVTVGASALQGLPTVWGGR